MRAVVCAKSVVADGHQYIKFSADGRDIDRTYATFNLNEPDAYALEEALRLDLGEVTVATVGDTHADNVLRTCLAMGATRAVRVWSAELNVHDPIAVAWALAAVVKEAGASIVFCGIQSSDSGQQATGPALAAVLGWPCVSAIVKTEVSSERIVAHRELDGGLIEIVEAALPIVCTVQTGHSTPRRGSFKQLMLAKRTPIAVKDPGYVRSRTRILEMSVPDRDGKRAEMIQGEPAEIARRIVDLIRSD